MFGTSFLKICFSQNDLPDLDSLVQIKNRDTNRSKKLVYVTIHRSKVNSKTYTTKAKRWYNERLTGSHQSNRDGQELWKRDETVQITVDGGLQGKTEIVLGETKPL